MHYLWIYVNAHTSIVMDNLTNQYWSGRCHKSSIMSGVWLSGEGMECSQERQEVKQGNEGEQPSVELSEHFAGIDSLPFLL